MKPGIQSRNKALRFGSTLAFLVLLAATSAPAMNSIFLHTFGSNSTSSSTTCAPYSYTVQPGDAPSTIAQRFGVPWEEIAQANNNIQSVSPFEPIVIPGVCDHTPAGSSVAPLGTLSSSLASSNAPRYVMIRFDDGYQDQYVRALPVLQKDNLTAAFMTITAAVQNGTIPKKVLYDWE